MTNRRGAVQDVYKGQRDDSCPGWDGERARHFLTPLRKAHNLKLTEGLFLEFFI